MEGVYYKNNPGLLFIRLLELPFGECNQVPGMLRVALIGNRSRWISATVDILMMRGDERRRNLLGHFNPQQLACIDTAWPAHLQRPAF